MKQSYSIQESIIHKVIERSIILYYEHSKVECVIIIGAPSEYYHDLQNIMPVCYMYNYEWDNELIHDYNTYNELTD